MNEPCKECLEFLKENLLRMSPAATSRQLLGVALRFSAWLRELDSWCERHQITRKQAWSILFNDRGFNAANPTGKDLVTANSLLSWVESNDFGRALRLEINNEEIAR